MQCARPREVLVDDLWDDYALRLMQRDYFETPSQREPLPQDAAKLAAPLSPLAKRPFPFHRKGSFADANSSIHRPARFRV